MSLGLLIAPPEVRLKSSGDDRGADAEHALTEPIQLICVGSRMVLVKDESTSRCSTRQRLLQPYDSLKQLRKHQLEPTSDLTNPVDDQKSHVMKSSLM